MPLPHDSPDEIQARTRAAYDTVAESYAAALEGYLDALPVERHTLALFADLVEPESHVIEVGCGPGHTTAHLAGLGLDVSGLDLSAEMVRVARDRHPGLVFTQGTMEALDGTDLGGVVAWYSLIHIPPAVRPVTIASFARALRPGGLVLLGFQVGNEKRHVTQGYGHTVSLYAWRLDPTEIEAELEDAGFTVIVRTIREPTGSEETPQAFLLARGPKSA